MIDDTESDKATCPGNYQNRQREVRMDRSYDVQTSPPLKGHGEGFGRWMPRHVESRGDSSSEEELKEPLKS